VTNVDADPGFTVEMVKNKGADRMAVGEIRAGMEKLSSMPPEKR